MRPSRRRREEEQETRNSSFGVETRATRQRKVRRRGPAPIGILRISSIDHYSRPLLAGLSVDVAPREPSLQPLVDAFGTGFDARRPWEPTRKRKASRWRDGPRREEDRRLTQVGLQSGYFELSSGGGCLISFDMVRLSFRGLPLPGLGLFFVAIEITRATRRRYATGQGNGKEIFGCIV